MTCNLVIVILDHVVKVKLMDLKKKDVYVYKEIDKKAWPFNL